MSIGNWSYFSNVKTCYVLVKSTCSMCVKFSKFAKVGSVIKDLLSHKAVDRLGLLRVGRNLSALGAKFPQLALLLRNNSSLSKVYSKLSCKIVGLPQLYGIIKGC